MLLIKLRGWCDEEKEELPAQMGCHRQSSSVARCAAAPVVVAFVIVADYFLPASLQASAWCRQR